MFKVYAKQYLEKFGFNVLPLSGKKPMINWEEWQNKKQTIDDLEKMEWNQCTGIGTVMGIEGLRCLDIDVIENEGLIDDLLIDLGLPEDYPWVIQSGSGEGFHIYFISNATDEEMTKAFGGTKAVYKMNMRAENICDHLELRWKDCQTVLPPSKHVSEGIYDFFNNDPVEKPTIVDFDLLARTLKKHCKIESKGKSDKQNQLDLLNERRNYIDSETLYEAVNFLSQKLEEHSYDDWLKCGFALASLGEEGYEYFRLLSLSNPNYSDAEDTIRNKFDSLLADWDGRVTIASLYKLAEIYGWKKPFLKFWDLDPKNKVTISRTKFKKFLEREGFFKIKKDTQYLFIRSENNIVEEFDPIFVKDYVLENLMKTNIEEFEGTSRADVINALIKGNNQYFTNQFYEFLITKDIEFQRDTIDTAYVYFRNGVAKVTKEAVDLIEYRSLNKFIWKKQIIQGDFYPESCHSDFEDFQFNICAQDPERLKALKTGMGYLLHNYKDPNQAKAVIFIDEKLSEGAFGRSGKGLVVKAIGKIRTVVTQDGRNFDVSKNFAFQRVNADTNIISIEDMRDRFPFDKLFSILTEGLTIEKKNRDEMYLSFTESPKVVISSNYAVQGVDDSTLDRQFIIEFSDHYNKNNRPLDEFGKLFFEGWDQSEWNAFYNYMINSLQEYLLNGLISYTYVNLERKRLVDETCIEFAEFSDSLILNNTYDKKELFEKFLDEYPEQDRTNQNTFTRWLKLYARIKNVEVMESKSGSTRKISLLQLKAVA